MIGTLLFWLVWCTGLALYSGVGGFAIYILIDAGRRKKMAQVVTFVSRFLEQRRDILNEQQQSVAAAKVSNHNEKPKKMKPPPLKSD